MIINIKKIDKKKKNFLKNFKIISQIQKSAKFKNFHGLAIDSREVKKDNLFLTIRGKNNDGLKFLPQAFRKGAKGIISSKKINMYKKKTIKVNNEISFLNKFALLKRNSSKAKIIELLEALEKLLKNLTSKLLQNFGETYCSPKSYNNHFGVPISLSQLSTIHKYGIFELGMSKAGEINMLSKLVKPHIGIITNIGEAHIENFKNVKKIADAKGEIINNIHKDGTLILNRDDRFFII